MRDGKTTWQQLPVLIIYARMPTKNVNLSDRHDRFIRQSVRGGQFRNASEVVRAGLRLLEQHKAEERLKLSALKKLATDAFDAIDRGEHITVAVDKLDGFFESLKNKAHRSGGRK
jgi:antitoxin ParD1/3/4